MHQLILLRPGRRVRALLGLLASLECYLLGLAFAWGLLLTTGVPLFHPAAFHAMHEVGGVGLWVALCCLPFLLWGAGLRLWTPARRWGMLGGLGLYLWLDLVLVRGAGLAALTQIVGLSLAAVCLGAALVQQARTGG